MIETTSNCLQAIPGDLRWASFEHADAAIAIRDRLHVALGQPKWFYYERFGLHGLRIEDGLAEVSSWSGSIVRVVFLDLTDPRVLRIDKAHLNEFFEEYVYPTEETYFVSENGLTIVCFDHNDGVHMAVLK